MQAAVAANVKPRLLIRVSGGLVDVFSPDDLDISVVYEDFEVRCDNVFQQCSSDELQQLLRRTSSYRYDPLYSKMLSGKI